MNQPINGRLSLGEGTGRAKCVVTEKPVPKGEACAWLRTGEFNRYALSLDGLLGLVEAVRAAAIARLIAPVVKAGSCPECGNPWTEDRGEEEDHALLIQLPRPPESRNTSFRITHVDDSGGIPNAEELDPGSLARLLCGRCMQSVADMLAK